MMEISFVVKKIQHDGQHVPIEIFICLEDAIQFARTQSHDVVNASIRGIEIVVDYRQEEEEKDYGRISEV